MDKLNMFFRLTATNLRRLKSYIVSILAAVIILQIVCSAAAVFISDNVYSEASSSNISIAYYLPKDDDNKYNQMALAMLNDMESIKSTVELISVSDIDQGDSLLSQGKVMYFIVVPENFFTGVMYGTNPPLEIRVRNSSTVTAYIANELLMSYAGYLGVAQSAVYSAIDTAREQNFSSEETAQLQYEVDLTFLDRALDKDNYMKVVTATDEGGYDLGDHYTASSVMLSLFLLGFIILPLLEGYTPALVTVLNSAGINRLHIFVSNFIVSLAALYLAYLPCFLRIMIFEGEFHPAGLVSIFPALAAISLIFNLINTFTKQPFVANMCLLIITLVTAYIGGGILPQAMLPEVIQEISPYLPGEHILKCVSLSLFN